jgi:hypothetical protein
VEQVTRQILEIYIFQYLINLIFMKLQFLIILAK